MEQQNDNIHEQIVEIQALKIEKGDQPNDVRKWSLRKASPRIQTNHR